VSFERTRRIAELSALPGNQITMNGESSYGWPGRGWHRTPPPSARAQWAPFGLLPETEAPAGGRTGDEPARERGKAVTGPAARPPCPESPFRAKLPRCQNIRRISRLAKGETSRSS
jgi:hypothetical protein